MVRRQAVSGLLKNQGFVPVQVLLIEDDAQLRITLQRSLARQGWKVLAFGTGAEGLQWWQGHAPDVVALDLTLPDTDGLQLLAQARAAGLRAPVLILTARGTVGDRVLGLNTGADDYLPKPFDLDELEARLRALARRFGAAADVGDAADLSALGEWRLDRSSGALYWRAQVQDLPPREAQLMRQLMRQPGRALSKEQLFAQVFAGEVDVQIEAVEVVAYRLRKRLQGTGVSLVTLRGLGYLLREDTHG